MGLLVFCLLLFSWIKVTIKVWNLDLISVLDQAALLSHQIKGWPLI